MMVNGNQHYDRGVFGKTRAIDVNISWKAYDCGTCKRRFKWDAIDAPLYSIIYKLHPAEVCPDDFHGNFKAFFLKGIIEFKSELLEGVKNLNQEELVLLCDCINSSNFMCNLFRVVPFSRYLGNADREIMKAEILNVTATDPKFMVELLTSGRSLWYRSSKSDMENMVKKLENYTVIAKEMLRIENMKKEMED